jgi:ubiquinone/menaquinone biosynthesis C-methylase UbiE
MGLLRDAAGLTPGSVVADVGSGTGISTEMLLRNGNTVYAVEPNAAMRTAAEGQLRTYPGFHSVAGSAEATTLPDASVDLVVAAQAFHWFDPDRARTEFRRVLRPPGCVALIWNERKTSGSPFLEAYEALLVRHGTDYTKVAHRNVGRAGVARFFGRAVEPARFPNEQRFDFPGLRGRLLSSSYVPLAGQPGHDELLAGMKGLFDRFQRDGRVTIEYEAEVYVGPL